MKSAARLAQYRSYRDTISKDFMEEHRPQHQQATPVYPDIAFKLPAPTHLAASTGESQTLTVGVGVMAYFGWRGRR